MLVKPLVVVLVTFFIQLFILSPNEWLLPADWLMSTAILVRKGGDRESCIRCGAASLTSIMLKTLEKFLRDVTLNHLEANKLTMMEQHGFGQNTFLSDQHDKLYGRSSW